MHVEEAGEDGSDVQVLNLSAGLLRRQPMGTEETKQQQQANDQPGRH
jgi:hypothetical protein